MNKHKNFLNSEDWEYTRKRIIEERGFECENCHLETRRLHLHHKNYEMEFGYENENDLILLCEDCHHKIHQDLECFGQTE